MDDDEVVENEDDDCLDDENCWLIMLEEEACCWNNGSTEEDEDCWTVDSDLVMAKADLLDKPVSKALVELAKSVLAIADDCCAH